MRTERAARPRGAWAALLLGALVLSACGAGREERAALEPLVVTHFSERTELFVEFAPLVAGERSAFAAHFTRLADFKPVTEGTVDIVLSGGGAPTERFRVEAPRRPGLFAPVAVPRVTGERRLAVHLEAPGLRATHDLGPIRVYASRAEAAQAKPAQAPEGEIGFLKEQQWQSDFATEAVKRGPLRASVTAPAVLRAAGDREFIVSAPVAGRVVGAASGLPVLGSKVEAGQVLALLTPRLEGSTDIATLEAELTTARQAAALATEERARVERLYAQEAVSERRVHDARAAEQVALAQLRAAQRRHAPYSGGERGGLALRAPLTGTLARVEVGNGAAVAAGDTLFHIVDRTRLWLEVKVPEPEAGKLRTPLGAAFELPGAPHPIEIVAGENGRLVGVGGVIDPVSRTVPVIFALDDPGPGIALNQSVHARVYTGEIREALSVPASAVIDDGGQRVVYVQRGGESFSRVPVNAGLRDGDRLEIRSGLSGSERVVSRGALLVRLAAATPEAMGHGHAH